MPRLIPSQIWDPFASVCRDVYCPAEFDLTSFTCLNPDGENGSIYDEEPMTVSVALYICSYKLLSKLVSIQVLPSSEVELTFTILVVDTTVPPPDPPPSMPVLADVITSNFPDERFF